MVEVSTTWSTRRCGSCGDRPRHPLGRIAVGQAQHDDVGAAGQLGRRSATNAAPVGVPLRSGDVVADDVVARADEVRRQDAAHVAEADEADRRHRQPSLLCRRAPASSARRAETPAGAPQ